MRITVGTRRGRRLLAGLLLAVLAIRAWVPAGFMPAPGEPFGLMVCGMDMPGHGEVCPFSAVPAAAPIAHYEPPAIAWIVEARAAGDPSADPARFSLIFAYRSRAPPALA